MRKKIILDFFLPLVILVSLTIVFWSTNGDIAIEKLFYSAEKGWYLKDSNPWILLYHHGNIPPLILAFAAIFVFAFSFISIRILPYRKIALFLVLFLAIGPGFITNTVFKNHWGRPRPRQIENFGGEEKFLAVWVKGVSKRGKSFPSGHASIGFFLFSPFFFLRKIRTKLAVFFLFLGVIYGTLMGVGRMIQGGHFASDVVWAGGFTYLTGLILYYLFKFDKQIWWTPQPSKE